MHRDAQLTNYEAKAKSTRVLNHGAKAIAMGKIWAEFTAEIMLAIAGIGVIAISILGSVARLFHDNPDQRDTITGRDWIRYLSAGLLAGLILSFVVYWHRGEVDPLLFGIAGLGGFGAIQFLGLGVEFGMEVMRGLTDKIKVWLHINAKSNTKERKKNN